MSADLLEEALQGGSELWDGASQEGSFTLAYDKVVRWWETEDFWPLHKFL